LTSSQPLRIHFWRYRENTRNYPGYHLTADADGCAHLSTVLSAHEAARRPMSTSLALAPLTPEVLSVPGNSRGNATVVALASLDLVTDPSYPDERFIVSDNGSTCRLELSRDQAGCVLEGVADILRGKGDYCIGGDGDHVVWFWWFHAR
jgi:hypothetical protein